MQVHFPVAYMAAQNGLNLNSGYFAREPKGHTRKMQEKVHQLKTGQLEPGVLYVLQDSSLMPPGKPQADYRKFEAEGFLMVASPALHAP